MSKKKGAAKKGAGAEEDDWEALLQEEIAKNALTSPSPSVVPTETQQNSTNSKGNTLPKKEDGKVDVDNADDDDDDDEEDGGPGAGDAKKVPMINKLCTVPVVIVAVLAFLIH